MKEQQKIHCSRCNRPINAMSWYCCDPEKHYCVLCSASKCKYCHLSRANIHKERQNKGLKGSLKKRCTVCNRPEELSSQPFFQQGKCKQFYCHSCLLMFYQNNYRMVESLKKQHGQAPLIDVELRCGCEIQKKNIVQYVKKYCFYCSGKMLEPGIKMKNQCQIMKKCYQESQRLSTKRLSDKDKNRKAFSIYNQIKQLLYECGTCGNAIEGDIIKINSACLCQSCYRFSDQFQNQQKQRHKKQQITYISKKEIYYNCDLCKQSTCLSMISPKRVCLKCDKDARISLQVQKQSLRQFEKKKQKLTINRQYQFAVQSQIKYKVPINSSFIKQECKICFSASSIMINKCCKHLLMCEKCFSAYCQRQKTSKVPCPLCKAIGEYAEYIAPIFS